MNQPRSILELLKVMLDNTDEFEDGLCLWRYNLYTKNKINDEERIRLRTYIVKNRPWFSFGMHYWSRGKLQPRLRWIRKHIKKLSKKNPEYYPPL